MHVPEPWVPAREGGAMRMFLRRGADAEAEEIVVRTDQWLYGLEADTFTAALARRERDVPQMSTADTLGNMAVLDAWRTGAKA